jgi:elongation factor G
LASVSPASAGVRKGIDLVHDHEASDIRNVALIGHGGCGKTTLAEALLLKAGATSRLGSVDQGTSVLDYDEDEIERKMSISTSLAQFPWQKRRINLLDTPGYADFIGEVVSALSVADGCVLVVQAVSGIEVGTETTWGLANARQLPCVIFVNKLGKEHADFDKIIGQLADWLPVPAVPLVMPYGKESAFKGVVDVITQRLYAADSDQSSPSKLPDEMAEAVASRRVKAMEMAAEADDTLLEKYLEEGELTEAELVEGLRKATIQRQIVPVLCGDAASMAGTPALLDAVVKYLPGANRLTEVHGTKPDGSTEVSLAATTDAPVSAMVFKTIAEHHVGEVSVLRVFSGHVSPGSELYNVNKATTERVGQIYNLVAREKHEVPRAVAGDIAALVKLKETLTGDTLCERSKPIMLGPIEFPKPAISVAVKPKAKGDEDKISAGLNRLRSEDPTFTVTVDGELRQTLLSGMGEMHLDVILRRLNKRFGVEVEQVKPKLPFRETILGTAEVQGKYKKQTGGRGQYGDVWLKLEPLPRGEEFEFANAIVGGAIPSKYIPAVEKGVREAFQHGVIAGYPVVDVKITLYDGSYHSVDSSDLAFKIAASLGFKKGMEAARPVFLEPIMNVEVIVPEEFMGDVMGDLSSRRGRIQGMDARGSLQVVRAQVPLAELYRYSTHLRSLTQGRGLHTREFSHYEQVPAEVKDKLIAEAKAAIEE